VPASGVPASGAPASDVPGSDVRAVFRDLDVLKRGHFQLSSGRHSDTYLQCALALQHPRTALSLGRALAERTLAAGYRPDVVASPALGGLLAGFAVAAALDRRFIYAERAAGGSEAGHMTLRRGQRLKPGEHVVIVEDVVTTGGSAREVAELARRAGATVDAVAALVDRSSAGTEAAAAPQVPGAALLALLRVQAATWQAEDCPLCAQDLPVQHPGSRPRTED
jgi:orotate phosphoribosyltransferase